MNPNEPTQPTEPAASQPSQPQQPAVPVQPEPAQAAPQAASASAAPGTPAWAQYVGHIVRWQDGTSWLVKEDGRHWIADGGTYQELERRGSKVFNLPAPELDKIPDIKGSKATL